MQRDPLLTASTLTIRSVGLCSVTCRMRLDKMRLDRVRLGLDEVRVRLDRLDKGWIR